MARLRLTVVAVTIALYACGDSTLSPEIKLAIGELHEVHVKLLLLLDWHARDGKDIADAEKELAARDGNNALMCKTLGTPIRVNLDPNLWRDPPSDPNAIVLSATTNDKLVTVIVRADGRVGVIDP